MRHKTLAGVMAVLAGLAVFPMSSRADEAAQEHQVIAWKTDVLAAYKQAIAEQKPLVVVFLCPLDREDCVYCKRMRGELFSETFQPLADQAVFVMTEVRRDRTSDDESAAVLYNRLEIASNPTVSVLAPTSHQIEELLRLNGYFDAEKLTAHVREGIATWNARIEGPAPQE